MSSLHPDQVLEQLLSNTTRLDKAERLSKLHEICRVEFLGHSAGARDLGLANIGRIAESHGLFKARVLYNKQSEDYATLIHAWEVYSGPVSKVAEKISVKSWGEKYPYISDLKDPAVRGMCMAIASERDRLKNEINTLKSVISNGLVIHLAHDGSLRNPDGQKETTVQNEVVFPLHERKALEASIDQTHLNRFNLKLSDTGEILNERGDCVFLPGFAQAIRRVLGIESKSVSEL